MARIPHGNGSRRSARAGDHGLGRYVCTYIGRNERPVEKTALLSAGVKMKSYNVFVGMHATTYIHFSLPTPLSSPSRLAIESISSKHKSQPAKKDTWSLQHSAQFRLAHLIMKSISQPSNILQQLRSHIFSPQPFVSRGDIFCDCPARFYSPFPTPRPASRIPQY